MAFLINAKNAAEWMKNGLRRDWLGIKAAALGKIY